MFQTHFAVFEKKKKNGTDHFFFNEIPLEINACL